ncbi:MAG: phosphoglycerate kinase [Patescibacteria group bacterium]|nr:phosphoglycerate kinase [Patescibacteria group bacterium]
MKLRKITDIKEIRGELFLVRVDYNVPIAHSRILDDTKIRRSLKTIRYLTARGGGVVLVSHFGRPEGKRNPKYSLRPIGARLSKLLKKSVYFCDAPIPGSEFFGNAWETWDGQVTLLENIRFYAGEEANSANWARELARPFDYFVNDAFASSHRAHASVAAVTKFLPSYAGFDLADEVENLERAVQGSKRPLVVVLGGAKISTKINLIKKFVKKADWLILGGGLANSALAARGFKIGASLVERTQKSAVSSKKIILPVDFAVGDSRTRRFVGIREANPKTRTICSGKEAIFDIGPKTMGLYKKYLAKAGTIIWNGPLGLAEDKRYARGTQEIARAIGRARGKTYAGGGETVMEINKLKLGRRFTFVSAGGGAMLEYLEGKKMPGLKPLIKK